MHTRAILMTCVFGAALAASPAIAQAPDFSKAQIKATDLGHGITELLVKPDAHGKHQCARL